MRIGRFAALAGLAALAVAFGGEMDHGPSPAPSAGDELAPPPAGQGFQLATEETAVAAGSEQQDCYFFKVSEVAKAAGLPENEPFNLHRIQIAQREGSHHMNIFRVKTVVNLGPAGGAIQKGTNGMGECFKSPNWADWPLVANTQIDGQMDWTYPDGVANVLQPDEYLMLQTHYVNASTQKTPLGAGKVRANFHGIPAAEVKHELGTIFATKQSIRVCRSNPSPQYFGTCQVKGNEPINIIGANGHFHSRGKQFDMFAWDGQSTTPDETTKFYSSQNWAEPLMSRSPELAKVIPPGGGVMYQCGFQWTEPPAEIGCAGLDAFDKMKYNTPDASLDCCYTFGPQVDRNEHCNSFVYYYPKRDDVNCF